jgi:hypothetical protein
VTASAPARSKEASPRPGCRRWPASGSSRNTCRPERSSGQPGGVGRRLEGVLVADHPEEADLAVGTRRVIPSSIPGRHRRIGTTSGLGAVSFTPGGGPTGVWMRGLDPHAPGRLVGEQGDQLVGEAAERRGVGLPVAQAVSLCATSGCRPRAGAWRANYRLDVRAQDLPRRAITATMWTWRTSRQWWRGRVPHGGPRDVEVDDAQTLDDLARPCAPRGGRPAGAGGRARGRVVRPSCGWTARTTPAVRQRPHGGVAQLVRRAAGLGRRRRPEDDLDPVRGPRPCRTTRTTHPRPRARRPDLGRRARPARRPRRQRQHAAHAVEENGDDPAAVLAEIGETVGLDELLEALR